MSRRDQIRLTDEEIRDFLREKKTIILNSNGVEGYPHPMPMWFTMDDSLAITMTTFRASQKIVNLKRDPRVSLLAESGTEYAELKGVVIYGKAELSEDLDEIVATLLAAADREVADDDDEGRRAMAEAMKKTASKRTRIRVRPEKIVSWDHAKLSGVY
jgi:nitroimidazol reductase NimA-like FMN-containing flavoprotein (pyridoxamine 5'-phosphate oxidase superfamily)